MLGILCLGIGVLGVLLCLSAYGLLQLGYMKSDQLSYILMNTFAALGILISLFYQWNFPTLLMEGSWFIFSLIGLIRYFLKRKHARRALNLSQ